MFGINLIKKKLKIDLRTVKIGILFFNVISGPMNSETCDILINYVTKIYAIQFNY